MGNIGRPSTGCGLCRKRRVKCDEGRPGCRNCARLKKPCPGYREPGFGFMRTTTCPPSQSTNTHPTTYQRQDSLSNPIAASSQDRQLVVNHPQSDYFQDGMSHQPTTTSRVPSPRSMTVDPEGLIEYSLWYALAQLDVNSRVIYDNHTFNFLPIVLTQAGPDSCVYAAMRSVSTVNLANRTSTMDMRPLVDFTYQKAVSAITRALADPLKYLNDETLIAVWLLAMRELFVGVRDPTNVTAYGSSLHSTHIEGTLMLLRARGDDQFKTPLGRHLYSTVIAAMHWKRLFDGEESSPEYMMLEEQMSKASFIPDATLKIRHFFHGVCKLRHRIKNFLSHGSPQPTDLQSLISSYLKAASRLEQKMLDWCDIPDWRPIEVDLSTALPSKFRTFWTTGSLYRRYSFPTFAGFFHWNRYLPAKILLHGAVLDVLTTLPPDMVFEYGGKDLDTTISEHLAIVHETTRDYLGIVGYAFGDVDASGRVRPTPTPAISDGYANNHRGIDVTATFQVEPPLSHLATFKYLAPGQREAVFYAMQRIQTEFSLR